jgi:hypothetical protein
MDGGRQLAVLPSALDMHYLPPILLTAHPAHAWEKNTRTSKLPRGWGCSPLHQRPSRFKLPRATVTGT